MLPAVRHREHQRAVRARAQRRARQQDASEASGLCFIYVLVCVASPVQLFFDKGTNARAAQFHIEMAAALRYSVFCNDCLQLHSTMTITIAITLMTCLLSVVVRRQMLKHGLGLRSTSDSELLVQLLCQPVPGVDETNDIDWPSRYCSAHSLLVLYGYPYTTYSTTNIRFESEEKCLTVFIYCLYYGCNCGLSPFALL